MTMMESGLPGVWLCKRLIDFQESLVGVYGLYQIALSSRTNTDVILQKPS